MIQSILGNLKCQIKMQPRSQIMMKHSHNDQFQICSDHILSWFSRIKNAHVMIIIQKLSARQLLGEPGSVQANAVLNHMALIIGDF